MERWDGERDRDSPVRENEDRNKRRRDFWDEEYDRGKVKENTGCIRIDYSVLGVFGKVGKKRRRDLWV